MYTKEQLSVVEERIRKEGMTGLLRPPPRSMGDKFALGFIIAAFVALALNLIYIVIHH